MFTLVHRACSITAEELCLCQAVSVLLQQGSLCVCSFASMSCQAGRDPCWSAHSTARPLRPRVGGIVG